ncbi:hypothetical protein [Nostoc sp. MS1]|uniref:hypothetical protein n=1 Tax=Nostoc sp. MS1 TaxID=2764711 RepID=UPI00295ED246|nr:hypothetical protein [Nostoc sp. MS1]BCL33866.1 hypothetical protein NSMS1_03130 [Nostoc sp. MS1]
MAIEQVLNDLRVRFGIEVEGINYDAIAAVTNYIKQMGICPAASYSQTAQCQFFVAQFQKLSFRIMGRWYL